MPIPHSGHYKTHAPRPDGLKQCDTRRLSIRAPTAAPWRNHVLPKASPLPLGGTTSCSKASPTCTKALPLGGRCPYPSLARNAHNTAAPNTAEATRTYHGSRCRRLPLAFFKGAACAGLLALDALRRWTSS